MLSGDVGKEKAVAWLRSFLFSESIAALYFPLYFALKVSDCDTFSLFPNGERKGSAEGTAAPRRAHYFTGTSPLGRVGKV